MWFDHKTSNVYETLRNVQKDVQKDRNPGETIHKLGSWPCAISTR